MLYELRTYEAMPGRLPALNKRFAEVTTRMFARHGLEMVGFWTHSIGGPSNQLVYMLRFDDMADRERKWAAFLGDKEWQDSRRDSEADGPIVNWTRAQFLTPTSYSPAT
jgi:hypothetical protein